MNLDGPSWREKLSPIPAVPTAAHVRAWQPVAKTPHNQGGDSCSRPQPSIAGGASLHILLFEVNLELHVCFHRKAEG